MKSQPVLDLPVTTFERMLDAASLLFAGGAMLFAISQYSSLPEQIPTHINGQGVIDQYGAKDSIFILPGLSIILAIGLIFLCKFPHLFNHLNKITPENAAFEYKRSRILLRIVNTLISLMFLVLTWNIIRLAQGPDTTLSVWFWVVFISMIAIPIVFIVASRKLVH